MNEKSDNQFYDPEEANQRFEAALRGARLAEAKPMKDVPRKRGESKDEPHGKGGGRRPLAPKSGARD